jgi:glycerol-3-phosphate acyltransferase PlsY
VSADSGAVALALHLVPVLLAAYLLGSIPFAVVVSRAFGLADPRSFGSGNPGATNVLRSGSKAAAALTLLGDAAKGAVAVLLCRALAEPLGLVPSAAAWAGAAAFAGHLYPVFLRFRGGKGVATFLGTLLALAPLVGVATCLLWVGVAYLTRYSSAASIVSAAAAALALSRVGAAPAVLPAVTVMAVFLIWRHRSNIVKLLKGTESKIGQRSAPSAPAADGPVAASAAPVGSAIDRQP